MELANSLVLNIQDLVILFKIFACLYYEEVLFI